MSQSEKDQEIKAENALRKKEGRHISYDQIRGLIVMMSEAKTVERFEVGGLRFLGKKPAYTHLRKIVNSHTPGDILPPHEAELFLDIVRRHPRAEDKIGVGIKHFEIDRGVGGTLCLKVVREDDTEDDISIKKCIYGNDTKRRRVLRALRRAIVDDVADLRKQWFDRYAHGSRNGYMRCALSGKYIRTDQGHMDHIPPMTFEVIALTFMAHKGLDFDDLEFNDPAIHREERLRDQEMEDDFRQWHANLAQMRFIADSQNHYDEELVRIKRRGLSINASLNGLRCDEQSDVRKVIFRK